MGAKRRKTHTLKQNQLRAKKTAVQTTKATEGGKEEGTPKTNPKETTVQPKQRRTSRPSGRETHTFGLGKTEMEGVTNDLTNTAISSPMSLEEKAPASRTKTFEKQGQLKRQATLDTSNEPHGTRTENDSHYVD